MIVEKVNKTKAAKIKQWPVMSNRASSMGHPCTRYLTLERTHWQEKTLHDVGLQYVFDLGNEFEQIVLKEMMESGVRIVEQQRPFEWRDYQITGHIDGKLEDGGSYYPFEIKSVSPFVFDSIGSVSDMLNSKYLHLRKYPAQMILYELMDNKERGVMLFKNKASGRLKEVWIDLDYDLGEGLIKKAEEINRHVAAGTLPDPIEWSDSTCQECGYLHVCLPDRSGMTEVSIDDNEELVELLEKYDRLKPIAKEYDEVDEQLKKLLNGRSRVIVGNFFVDGYYRKSTRYDVPKEIKAQYANESEYWVRKIRRI